MRFDQPAELEGNPAGDGAGTLPRDHPEQPPRSREKIVRRIFLGLVVLLAALVVWLTVTAPLSRSLQPVDAPSLTILSAEGEPIARRGATIGEPVVLEELPPHVPQAFLAIEDRRFFRHIGIDPWGILRASVRNLQAGGVREGGSTISQQLAKTSFLSNDRTMGRKAQEALIALWLEVWLTKEEILERYLSNVYFGDNVYGLSAAARHYFSRPPEELTVSQAAMLAGLVKAPSRLAPTDNLEGAQERSEVVMQAMADAGYLGEAELDELEPARLRVGPQDDVPTGTYFSDWVLPEAAELAEDSYGAREVRTTLEIDLQRAAERAVRGAGLGRAQAALVAMRPDGRVVAMVGGKNYGKSPFNRATQARRQPGSAFKLFVYLAALRSGLTPDSTVLDAPISIDGWSPENHDGVYLGPISLRQALAVSSNVAAVRLQDRIGADRVIRAARDLGVNSPLEPRPSLALGTAGTSLIEMTSAYAAVAAGRYPIRPRGLPEERRGWLGRWWPSSGMLNRDRRFPMLRDMLHAAANRGTGRAAALELPTFGKTGTTQDYRDALFIGFAGDLVVGVWIGNDDNSPLPGVSGGGLPARIWRSFMTDALDTRPAQSRPTPIAIPQPGPVPSGDPGDVVVTPDGLPPVDFPPGAEPEGSPPTDRPPLVDAPEAPVRIAPPAPPRRAPGEREPEPATAPERNSGVGRDKEED